MLKKMRKKSEKDSLRKVEEIREDGKHDHKKAASVFLFYVALTLAEIGWMFTKVNYISEYCGHMIYAAILLLLVCYVIQSMKYTTRQILLSLLLIIVFSVSAHLAGNSTILLLLLFCLTGKNIDFKKLIDYNWKLMTVLILIVLLCYNLGATDIYYMLRPDGTIRSSMGFSHPNKFGIYLFCAFSQFLYSKHKKVKMPIYVCIGLFLAFVALKYSDSRSSAYSFIILLVLLPLIEIIRKRNMNLLKIIAYVPILFAALSLILIVNYDPSNKVMRNIDRALTTRISSAKVFVDKYDITPFGQQIELVNTEQAERTGEMAMVLDNAYAKLLYQYGLLATVLFMSLYCISIKVALRKGEYLTAAMLLIFAIHGLAGNVMFCLYGNIFLLYFSRIIYGEKRCLQE